MNKYAIVVEMWVSEEGTQNMFLNVEKKSRAWYMTEEKTSETLVFYNENEANAYINKHNLNESCCWKLAKVAQI